MKVKIVSIDIEKPHTIRDKVVSYEGEFECEYCSGSVYFVPYGKQPESLKVGKSISVETDFESVDQIEVLTASAESRLKPLETPFSYEMIGQVAQNSGDSVFDIDVYDLPMALDIEETNGQILNKGEWVRFVVHGLSLWDENTN